MGISLQGELEPLLTKLQQVADSKFWDDAVIDPTNPAYVRQATDGLAYFNQNLTNLITRFRGYYTLDGHDLDPLADQFAGQSDRWESPTGSSVYCSIVRAAEDVDEVQKLIHAGEWKGDGADSYYHNFLVPFKNTAVTHSGCAREMAIGAKSLADGVELTKECVVWICRDLISRLGGGGDPGPPPGSAGTTFKEAAGLTAILADTVALFRALTSPEGLIDAGLAAIGVTGGLIAESKSPSHEQQISVAPDLSASGLVFNAGLSLDRLDMNIAALDEQIGKGLETDLDSSGPFGSPFARIQNPHLQSSAYQQLKGRGFGNPTDDSNDIVVVNVVQLYYAGYHTLPSAAEQYDIGARICSEAHIDGVQQQFPKAVPKFNQAAQTFNGLLAAVRDDLTESGRSMVTAASSYRGADQYEAAQIRALENEIPAPGSFAGAEHYTPPEWLNL
ncbi:MULTISPECIES: hypothetical protein [unclassified Nocardia]|uniref:hypothetical protein n=1 Tax=unclassified Nocardia TaxID=2637762 RepID=UPI001CE4A67E|nr:MULTISPECIES: hypothetical protein [unclassified Nocardia]